ncbi:hypothetical protein OY671_006529 [Metschnikowia pulcherrima]|nr:hypothetical protein OY671_006529 [Metschnikowia pulcherrima]
MSSTDAGKYRMVLAWLSENAFWNAELLELKPSKIGGLGVFWTLGPKDDENNDRLMLRVPKSNILSPANSFIHPLLMEYQCKNADVGLKAGMPALILTTLYELSQGTRSPWFYYLKSIDFYHSQIPLCFWADKAKEPLRNTECDILGMLESKEAIRMYWECVRFAESVQHLVPIPSLLNRHRMSQRSVNLFGRFLQAVISRAFHVDKYHGLALVPGADLFNHLSPLEKDGVIQHRENVHFECDDGDDLCAYCGETGCAHMDESDDEELADLVKLAKTEAMQDSDRSQGTNEMHDIQEEEEEGDEEMKEGENGMAHDDLAGLVDEICSDEEQYGPAESDTDEEDNEIEENGLEENGEKDGNDYDIDIDVNKPITMADIAQLEDELENDAGSETDAESEAETDLDDEEASTISGEEKDEANGGQENFSEGSSSEGPSSGTTSMASSFKIEGAHAQELAEELTDGTKCCDIVVAHLPNERYDYELFNTYGNSLSNAYLLQRYGFVSEKNPNTTCSLSVQVFADIKRLERTEVSDRQIKMKLEWLERCGFDVINDLSVQMSDCRENSNGNDDDADDADECDNKDKSHSHTPKDSRADSAKSCADSCCSSEEEEEPPQTWELAPQISPDARPSKQTVAILRLLLMHFNVFYHKLYRCPSERRLEKRVHYYFMSGKLSREEKIVLRGWVKDRLGRLGPDVDFESYQCKLINMILADERTLLTRALELLKE